MRRLLPVLPLLAIAIFLPACTSHLQQKENFLSEAGFRTVTPKTPAQAARIKSLPQGHITKVTRKGKTLFMLADARKNMLLVGSNAQFEKYQQILYTKQVDPAIAEDKVIKMEDAEWGAWGGLDEFGGMGGFGGLGMPMMMY